MLYLSTQWVSVLNRDIFEATSGCRTTGIRVTRQRMHGGAPVVACTIRHRAPRTQLSNGRLLRMVITRLTPTTMQASSPALRISALPLLPIVQASIA